MSNPNYLFRFPKNTPRFDFANLDAFIGDDISREVGTTVKLFRVGYRSDHRIRVKLYEKLIAEITPEHVAFLPDGDDGHNATKHWVSMIARHNGISAYCGRRRRRKSDGPGPITSHGMAGVLEFYGGGLVVGKTYRVHLDNRKNTLWLYEREHVNA